MKVKQRVSILMIIFLADLLVICIPIFLSSNQMENRTDEILFKSSISVLFLVLLYPFLWLVKRIRKISCNENTLSVSNGILRKTFKIRNSPEFICENHPVENLNPFLKKGVSAEYQATINDYIRLLLGQNIESQVVMKTGSRRKVLIKNIQYPDAEKLIAYLNESYKNK